jgi:hypothetical protein
MSNTDSFIDEVTEEVRRDQLFQYLRRYGWIAVLVVLLLVGGTAWNEWRKAQSRAEAQARGDAMLAAIQQDAPEARAEALLEIETEGAALAVNNLLAAADLQEAGDLQGALDALGAVSADSDVPPVYRDLAALKAAMIDGSAQDIDSRRAALSGLAQPGAPFRMVALEQLALLDVEQGNSQAAIDQFGAIAVDAEATRGLRDRALQMIVALGGEIGDLALPGGQ